MKRIIITVACLIISLLFIFSAAAFAAAPQGEAPAVWIDDQTVTAGNSFSFYIKARNLENVGALSLSLIYDATQFEFSAISAQSMIDSEIRSANTQNEGVIGMDFISLSGVNGSGNLWRVTLKAKSTATSGNHTLTLAVGEAYTVELSPITIVAENARVTVNEYVQSTTSISFYSSRTKSSLTEGEQSTITLNSYDLHGLATADFEIEYDHTLLRLDEVTLGNKMI